MPAPPPRPEPSEGPPAATAGEEGPLNINEASYDQLRKLGLSVTQTGRVLASRDQGGGFKSLDELDSIPGFPRSFLSELKAKVTL